MIVYGTSRVRNKSVGPARSALFAKDASTPMNRISGFLFAACGCFLFGVPWYGTAGAQEMHRIHTSGLPMGEVGQTRLAQGGPVHGYYQPVRFSGPEGVEISLASDARFRPASALPSKVGLLLGQVYRMRLSGIPFHADQAVYPTVELIDRTYPPLGEALEFPIAVEFTFEDIESALAGKYVTKVVYLENPYLASPIRTEPDSPLNWDVQPGADPLVVANTMGRPVAIVRIGGRAPGDSKASDPSFFLGCPPWIGIEQNPDGQVFLTYNTNRFPTVPTTLIPTQHQPGRHVPGWQPQPVRYVPQIAQPAQTGQGSYR